MKFNSKVLILPMIVLATSCGLSSKVVKRVKRLTALGQASVGYPGDASWIAEAKTELVGKGIDTSGPCGAFQIINLAAWKHRSSGIGLLSKPSGNNCEFPAGSGNRYSVDWLIFEDGAGADVLVDAGGSNSPTWSMNAPDASMVDRWRAPVDPGFTTQSYDVPNPVNPPDTGSTGPGPSPTPTPPSSGGTTYQPASNPGAPGCTPNTTSVYVALTRTYSPMDGFDTGKLNDPNHTTPKYVFGRAVQDLGIPVGDRATMSAAIPNIVNLVRGRGFPGAQQTDDDKIDFDDCYGSIDILTSWGSWWWGPVGG